MFELILLIMSNDELLKFLRDIIDNCKNMSAMIRDINKIQKECFEKLIECKEDSIEQDKLITALAAEVIILKERVKKLEIGRAHV